MDVSLSVRRLVFVLISLSLISCGNRYDLSTAAGQQARIDDANGYLSRGDCASADAAINPLYASPYVTEQVVLIKASAQACFAHYNLLTFASNLVGAQNYFNVIAKSLDNTAGDAARNWMYNAVDVLTGNGASMNAGQRSVAVNSYMVFIQLGVIAAILRNYGNPDASGKKGSPLSYPGNVSNQDACALSAAFSFLTDSFANADLSDSDSKNLNGALNSICSSAGLATCALLNRNRNVCDGVNAQSVVATQVVFGVNSNWQ